MFDNQAILAVFILATILLARSMVKDVARMAATGRRREAAALGALLLVAFVWLAYLVRFLAAPPE